MSRRVTPFTSTPPRCGWEGDLSLKVPSGPAAAGITQSTPLTGVTRNEGIHPSKRRCNIRRSGEVHSPERGNTYPKKMLGNTFPKRGFVSEKVVIVSTNPNGKYIPKTNLSRPWYPYAWGGSISWGKLFAAKYFGSKQMRGYNGGCPTSMDTSTPRDTLPM